MIAVFYDRKHGREVTSAMLMSIHMVETAVVSDSEDRRRPKVRELFNKHRVIGELGYKGPNCGSHRNWDHYVMLSDLVFLRLEDEPTEMKGTDR